MKWFEDGYIEYESGAMVIVLENHHYASNNIYSMGGVITFDVIFDIENRNDIVIQLIDEVQKKYREYNHLDV